MLCDYCGKQNEFQSEVTVKTDNKKLNAPREGDLTVCIGCGGIHQYDHEIIERKVTDEFMELIRSTEPDVYKMLMNTQQAIKNVKERKK